jgi:hypothetical protein
MRHTNILLIVLIAVLVTFSYGCSKKEGPSMITGNVISTYGPEDTQPVAEPSSVNITLNSTLNLTTPTVKQVVDRIDAETAPSTTKIASKDIPASIDCDEVNINPGYKDCFNTTSGKLKLLLKNSGYENITGMIFNIETKGAPPNYEISNKGIFVSNFTEYTLDMPRWINEYKNTNRIIMIPIKKGNNGENTCFNRAMLLVPLDSCDKYLIQR